MALELLCLTCQAVSCEEFLSQKAAEAMCLHDAEGVALHFTASHCDWHET